MNGVIRELDVDNRCSPKASSYDRFSAGLVASILICTFVVLGLLVVWLFGSNQQSRGVPPILDPHPDVVVEDDSGMDDDIEEAVGGSGSTELVSFLQAVENAVSEHSADNGSPGDPGAPGISDDRKPGPKETKDSWVRWKIGFEVENIEKYKRQLDFLGVEIGVVDRIENDIWRIGNLSADVSVTQTNRENEAKSFYFAHSKPVLKRWDQKIATEAGVDSSDRVVVQFYPARLVAKITLLEAEKLEELGRELDDVVKTHIRISESGDQFSVSISDIEFR